MPDWQNRLAEALLYNPQEPLIFSAPLFWLFFAFVLLGYQFLYRYRPYKITFLTIFSLFFYYKSSGFYFILLLFSTVVDYYIGHGIYQSPHRPYRTLLLVLSLCVNLSLLAYYKYAYLLTDFINHLFGTDWQAIDYLALIASNLTHKHIDYTNIFLPVGISFFTFQTISYSVDVYRGRIKPVRNIIDFAFYVSFFPQLVAGPIVRAAEFVPQIYQPYHLNRATYGRALFLILSGLLKKMLISDYLSVNFVDRVFADPKAYTGIENLMAVYGYALQIYCDFSGYTDIAIGIALLLGFQLPLNFNSPYKAESITDFWRRWHMSLSSWLRDYLYIPLGGNRSASLFSYGSVPLALHLFMLSEHLPIWTHAYLLFGLLIWLIWRKSQTKLWGYIGTHLLLLLALYAAAQGGWLSGILCMLITIGWVIVLLRPDRSRAIANYLNLLLTMLLGGIWHGAHLRFLLWGFLHGVALALHKLWMEWRQGNSREKPTQKAWYRLLSQAITFHFVCFCWIFFRANDIELGGNHILPATEVAWQMLGQMVNNLQPQLLPELIVGYGTVFSLMAIGYFSHWMPTSWKQWLQLHFIESPEWVKALVFVLAILLIYQVSSAELQPFIYFQF